jgi:hypothetical protein
MAGGKSYRLKDKMKAGSLSEFAVPQVDLKQEARVN